MPERDDSACVICGGPLRPGDPVIRPDGWTRRMVGRDGMAHYTCLARAANRAAYMDDSTPWEIGRPHPALVEYVGGGHMPRGRVFEPGPGRGDNALFLAANGFDVTVADITPSAIAVIRRRADELGLVITTLVGDVIFELKPETEGFDYVFERSFLQTLPPEIRSPYVERMHDTLRHGGRFIAVVRGPRDPPATSQPYSFTEDDLIRLLDRRFDGVRITPTVSGHGDTDLDFWFVVACKK